MQDSSLQEDDHPPQNASDPHSSFGHVSKPPNEGRSKFQYVSGPVVSFDGEFKAGMRHGKGMAVFSDGVQYRGNWRLDKKHGVGEEVNLEHTTYHGEYSLGLRHGKGVEITVYGDEYNGEWSQGMRSGAGDYFSDGLHYVGEFLDNNRHGNCEKCVFRNGDVYSGEFKENLMDGKGSMITSWGAKYDGTWHQGKMHGHGSMLFPSGDSYTGEWMNGRRSGRGIYKSMGGGSYDGEWDNGKRHGSGIYRTFQKGATENTTSSGIPFRLLEGETYDGGWRHGLRHGAAKISKKGQVLFEGTFLNDKRDGEGRALLKDGSVYSGGWQEGMMHGRGKIISEGSEAEALWHFGACKQVISGVLPYKDDGEEGAFLAAFERGRNRLIVPANRTDTGTNFQNSPQGTEIDRFTVDSIGTPNSDQSSQALLLQRQRGLDNIDEEDEAFASRNVGDASLQGGQFFNDGDFTPKNHGDSFSSGLKLPEVLRQMELLGAQQQRPEAQRPEGQALGHDELVNMSQKHGVQLRGEFNRDGSYVPPVTKETYEEWTHLNSTFAQSKGGKGQAAKGDSPYSFEVRRPPGYGEGSSLKQAKLRAPRKTDKDEASVGEFSYRRWRMERGDSGHGRESRQPSGSAENHQWQ